VRGVPGALTGPVERGDSETVARHVAAIARRAPGISSLYAELGRAALRTARAKGSIGSGAARRLGRVLR
jgi:predicted short-subunit dehydrogenase-like oxidoreductase (DUF2520 family)